MLHQQRLKNCGTEPSLHSWIWPNGQGFIYLRFVLLKFTAVAQKLVGLCQRRLMPYTWLVSLVCAVPSVIQFLCTAFRYLAIHILFIWGAQKLLRLYQSHLLCTGLFSCIYTWMPAVSFLGGKFSASVPFSLPFTFCLLGTFLSQLWQIDWSPKKTFRNYTHSIGSILGQSPGDWSNGFWICLKWLIYWGDLGRELSDKEERDSGHLNVKPFHYLQIRHQNVAPFEAYPHVLLEEGWKHCQCESDMM